MQEISTPLATHMQLEFGQCFFLQKEFPFTLERRATRPHQLASECSPSAPWSSSSSSSPWKLVRKANSPSRIRPTDSGGGVSDLCFNKPYRWFWCTLEGEEHRPGVTSALQLCAQLCIWEKHMDLCHSRDPWARTEEKGSQENSRFSQN